MAEGAGDPDRSVPVTVCVAMGPGRVEEVSLAVPAGARVSDVANLPSVRALLSDAGADAPLDVGIWGQRCPVSQPVVAGDRVEIYRPLRVDPMTARRERFKKQGVRATGLFASPTGRATSD
jgi:putative ubiquitin-RnfH superfamily antitoxin RatB of RatAB toxin-antitoxin module